MKNLPATLEKLACSNVELIGPKTGKPATIAVGQGALPGGASITIIGPGDRSVIGVSCMDLQESSSQYRVSGMQTNKPGVLRILMGGTDHNTLYEIHQRKGTLPGNIAYEYWPMEDYVARLKDIRS